MCLCCEATDMCVCVVKLQCVCLCCETTDVCVCDMMKLNRCVSVL